LAAQIGDSISKYGSYLKLKHAVIFGGVSKVPQIQMLKQGVEIIVATPGRLLDLMQQKAVHLDQVEFFVLDEADRMLDMGFIPDIRKIIKSLPMNKQTLFFSATMEADIGKLARTLVHKPAYVTIDPGQPTVERIVQSICFIDKKNKDALLCSLIKDQNMKRVIVFTQMKHVANKVTQRLIEKGIRAMAIHGNKSQAARIKALESFRAGSCHVLVATDIAARGIDIDNIGHVINYDLPNEPETYVHRIGRTARAGKEGEAFSFCSAEERNYLRMIEALQRKEIPIMEHPFHCDLAQNATGADAKPKPKAQRNPLQKGGKRFAKAKNSMRDTRFNKNGLQIRSRKSQ
jgi:ATP-dependent RNA helicase RhlE